MKAKYIIATLVAVAIAFGVVRLTQRSSNNQMKMPITSASTTSSAKAVFTNMVQIASYTFKPEKITVKIGTTVTWSNTDSVSHTVTADQTSADAPNSALFGRGQTYSFTFNKAGTYAYHCMPHTYMHGSVIVTN